MKKLLILMAWAVCVAVHAQDAGRQLFTADWRFMLADKSADYSAAEVNDSCWRQLNLPHDWAIEGDFSIDNPSGTGGGALPGGVGWYRKTFTIDEKAASRRFRLDFDGAYMNATVWVNGHELGTRPYGYISFGYDITPYINIGKENVVAVRVDNSDQPNSRWYSGCGIYRNVWLTVQPLIHMEPNGTYITTEVSDIVTKKGKAVAKKALVTIRTTIRNSGDVDKKVAVRQYLLKSQSWKALAFKTEEVEVNHGCYA